MYTVYLALTSRSEQLPHFAAKDLVPRHASDAQPCLILEQDIPVGCGGVHQQNPF